MSGLGRLMRQFRKRRKRISLKERSRRNRAAYLRGERSEKIVDLAAAELINEGMLESFVLTRRNSLLDRKGIDGIFTTPEGTPPGFPKRIILVQIKSSDKYAAVFEQEQKRHNGSEIVVLVIYNNRLGRILPDEIEEAKQLIKRKIICKRQKI